MHRLGVNIDHVATIRQARLGSYPDPVFAAMIAEQAGADNITLHIREDRRHTQERDLAVMKKTIHIKLNLEMAATEELKAMALKYLPDSCTLVPEKRVELTTEGGLDLLHPHNVFLKDYCKVLKDAGIEVSLFIDADKKQIEKALELEVDAIEINSGKYSEAKNKKELELFAKIIEDASKFAVSKGLKTHIGHGINYENAKRLVKIEEIDEFNIGHSIVARALFTGFETAVKDMMKIIEK